MQIFLNSSFIYVILPCKNGFVNILGSCEHGFWWQFCKIYLKKCIKSRKYTFFFYLFDEKMRKSKRFSFYRRQNSSQILADFFLYENQIKLQWQTGRWRFYSRQNSGQSRQMVWKIGKYQCFVMKYSDSLHFGYRNHRI